MDDPLPGNPNPVENGSEEEGWGRGEEDGEDEQVGENERTGTNKISGEENGGRGRSETSKRRDDHRFP